MAETVPIGWGWNYPVAWEAGRSPYSQPRHMRRCITPPTAMPVTLEEAVLHLRLDPDANTGPEAPLIEGMIAAATRAVEQHASIAVMQQTWQMTLQHFPIAYLPLEIPLPPFKDLKSVTILGDAQDLAEYGVELDDRMPAKMYPTAHFWRIIPIPRKPGAIVIEWECGRERAGDVSPTIKQAILMAVGTWYENRESLAQFTLTPMLEIGWESLLGHYREIGFA